MECITESLHQGKWDCHGFSDARQRKRTYCTLLCICMTEQSAMQSAITNGPSSIFNKEHHLPVTSRHCFHFSIRHGQHCSAAQGGKQLGWGEEKEREREQLGGIASEREILSGQTNMHKQNPDPFAAAALPVGTTQAEKSVHTTHRNNASNVPRFSSCCHFKQCRQLLAKCWYNTSGWQILDII